MPWRPSPHRRAAGEPGQDRAGSFLRHYRRAGAILVLLRVQERGRQSRARGARQAGATQGGQGRPIGSPCPLLRPALRPALAVTFLAALLLDSRKLLREGRRKRLVCNFHAAQAIKNKLLPVRRHVPKV